jgi:signal transduction histidine kinase
MILFIIIIFFFLQKRQYEYSLELQTIRLNYDKELYKTQLEIQEQTFKQISREIHDNVGQYLSLARLGLITLDTGNPEEAESGIAEIGEILEKALEDLRDISKSMNPDIIRKGGLKKAIEMQVGFLQRGGKYHVTFDVDGAYRSLSEQKEVVLFRILQEAINNIIRHADASDIAILLDFAREELKLFVRDNGKGFDLRYATCSSGKIGGIANMQQRTKLIEGRFDIETAAGSGTTIVVSTPI